MLGYFLSFILWAAFGFFYLVSNSQVKLPHLTEDWAFLVCLLFFTTATLVSWFFYRRAQ